MPYPRIREAVDSSSGAILQATAAALSGGWFQPQQTTSFQARIANLTSRLPAAVVQRLVAMSIRDNALDPTLARYITTEGLARQALQTYARLGADRRFPAILIGAPSGGAAYLAALLGAPFLPAHFTLSFAGHNAPDDIVGYQRQSDSLIGPILERNADLHAVSHYDPIHERLLVEHACQMRLKLLDLPEAYRQFIRRHLAQEGTLIFVDGQLTWHQYQLGERHTLQVGGLGGFSDEAYRHGSEAIDAWLAAQSSAHRGGWTLEADSAPLTESEWGSMPDLQQAARHFASAERYEYRTLSAQHPEDASVFAYLAYLWEACLRERKPGGVLIESYSQINPTAALRSHLLPLWLPSNDEDGLAFLSQMSDSLPADLPIVLSLFPRLPQTPDQPPAQAWLDPLESAELLAIDPERYPHDLKARQNYLPHLRDWALAHPAGEPAPHLTPKELQQLMHYLSKEGSGLLGTMVETVNQLAAPDDGQRANDE